MKGFLGLALMATVLVDCKGSETSGPKIDYNLGTYNLVQVNGGGLPSTVFQNSAGRLQVTGGTLILRDDKSYMETLNFNTIFTAGGQSPTNVVENGSYLIVGSSITFSIPASGSNPAFSYTGAVDGGILTYTYDGIAYRYLKN